MGYFKKKIILTLLGILILIALFSCVSYFTFALSFGNKQQQTNAADLTISTLAELQTFANNVNNGNTYSGKTVVLGADIDCGGATITINAFSGTFDGNWKTISNMTVNGQYMETHIGKQNVHYDYYNVGFIGKLDGTVKNLRLSDISCTAPDEPLSYEYIGGVAGFATDNSIITQCCVENFTTSGGQTSGILATGNATISNCYTENIVTSAYIGGIGPCTTSWTVPGAGSKVKSDVTIIENCVAVNNSYTYPISAVTNITNCCSAANQTEGLDLENTWYYNSSFNDGYPYLRSFLSFFYFDCDGDGNYDATRPIAGDQVSATINLMGVIVQYKDNKTIHLQYVGSENVDPVELEGHSFDGWEKVDDYHYKATYKIRTFLLEFMIGDENISLEVDGEEVSDTVNYTVNYGTEITISLTSLSQSEAYSKILFTFNDNITVEYVVDSTHYCEGYIIGGESKTDTSITVTGETAVTIITYKKTYTPEYE